jgi:hypothetical protein
MRHFMRSSGAAQGRAAGLISPFFEKARRGAFFYLRKYFKSPKVLTRSRR